MIRPNKALPKGVVFDLDDTLYPQHEFKRSGFRAVGAWLEERQLALGSTVIAVLEDIMRRSGPSQPRMFDQAVNMLGLPGLEVAELGTVFRRHRPSIALYPGVSQMLRRLRTNMQLGLLTDGLASVQRNKVAVLGLEPLIDRVVFSDALETSKPDATLFAGFEMAFGLDGSELMYVGDNPAKDFVGARARGWQTVRVGTGEHATSHPPTSAYAADHDIAAVTDLVDVIAQLSHATQSSLQHPLNAG